MIDTLMVLWTSGAWKHFLRSFGTFLLIFTCICVLLLLVTTSGTRWSSLAVTVAQSHASRPSSAATAITVGPSAPAPSAVPTVVSSIEPVILQNPIVAETAPAAAHSSHAKQKQIHHVYHSAPVHTPRSKPTASTDTQTQQNNPGFPYPSNSLPTFP